jgi:hypothetical protein
MLAITLQALHFHFYYEQTLGRAVTWATVDWTAWFLVIGFLHAGLRRLSPPGRWRYVGIATIVLLAGITQIILSTGGFRFIYVPSRPFWSDVLHLLDKRWFQGLVSALLLWSVFTLLWRRRATDGSGGSMPTHDAGGPLEVHEGSTVHWLDPAEILSMESARNYVFVHLGNRRILARGSLTDLAGRLPAGQFLRISRSCCVQRCRIVLIEPCSRYGKQVVLDNGAAFRIGRTYLHAVVASLRLR